MSVKNSISKNSRFYLIGEEGRKIMMRKRLAGATYAAIAEFLNEHYGNLLTTGEVFSVANVGQYFRIHGKMQEEAIRRQRVESVAQALCHTESIEKLINYLTTTVDYYQEQGERLRLKDAINSLIKLYELKMKSREGQEKESQSTEVSRFLQRVQKEFVTPSVVKRVEQEMDKEGNIVKQTATEIRRNKDEEEEEVVEAETEAVSVNN